MVKRIGLSLLALLILLTPAATALETTVGDIPVPEQTTTVTEPETEAVSVGELPDYYTYLKAQGTNKPLVTLTTVPSAGTGAAYPASAEGRDGVVILSEDNAEAHFAVTVGEAGLYNLQMTYRLLMENTLNATFDVHVDGKLLHKSTQMLAFPRRFVNESGIRQDANGNDRVPTQTEVKEWNTWIVDDGNVESGGGLRFWLEAGSHTITLKTALGGVAVTELTVFNPADAISYEEYLSLHTGKADNVAADTFKEFEAAEYTAVSDSVINPTYDRSSVATQPNDPSKLKLNTIGQSNWNKAGQWIEWKLDVPEDGWYEIGMRVRQNVLRGAFSTRKVWIDDQLLFDELSDIQFPYKLGWYVTTLKNGEGESYRFYLEKGIHTLRMEATQGVVAESITEMENLTLELNNLYRNIIMVTGASIDSYRDYMLEQQVPDLLGRLTSIRDRLQKQMDVLAGLGIGKGSEAVVVDKLIYQIDSFIENPDSIPARLGDFLSNISSMSSWAMSFVNQPLEVDYIYVKAPGVEDPEAGASFWNQLVFRVQALIASFVEDYTSIAGTGGEVEATKSIRVWVALGRDQGQIVKDLTESRFTPESGVSVQLSLMQAGLNEAIAAGRGPDVALFTGDVVNLASREALEDLSECEGFDEVVSRFTKDALVPFTYQSGVYAMPMEQTSLMMFYRTDILEELGLSAPTTWDEFTYVLAILQKNRLTAGLYAGTSTAGDTSIFEIMLYQKGGSLFNEDLSATVLDNELCHQAFKQWTDYYVEYSLPTEFDFYNRFRSGEMPLGIQGQGMYATLRLAAPELDGLWEMAPVPQTVDENGNVSDVTVGGVTPAIVLKGADVQTCFDYLNWLTTTEIQVAYGQEVENVLGLGARYNSANMEAVAQLNWTKEESALLISQLEKSYIRPAIPASYYINRNLTNAFRKVVISGYTPREALLSYNKIINSEITRKNNELAARAEKNQGKED